MITLCLLRPSPTVSDGLTGEWWRLIMGIKFARDLSTEATTNVRVGEDAKLHREYAIETPAQLGLAVNA